MGAPKAPKIPKPEVPLPEPTPVDPEVIQARNKQKSKAMNFRGNTLLTSPQGLDSSSGLKTFLGS